MQPNISIHESFGKFIFILFDLICGYLILKINLKQTDKINFYEPAIIFWFYNPITIAISSRGNAESLMAFLVLAFIYLLKTKSYLSAGVTYAISIHFKIYPVIYGLALFLNLIDVNSLKRKSIFQAFRSIVFNWKLLKFGLAFLFTITSLSIIFFKL